VIINGPKLVIIFQIFFGSKETFQQVYLVISVSWHYCLLFVPLRHAPQAQAAQAEARDLRKGQIAAHQDHDDV
jgi:hypothetical protein